MNVNAINNKRAQSISSFDMSNTFYTDSMLFTMFKINEKVMDIVEKILGTILFILCIPLMLIIFLSIKWSMGGDVFYLQDRVGKNGKIFSIIKFRTMINDAEASSGPTLSSLNDVRVTNLGKILRASHLDEIPQLINVIQGDMAFIGPRPERPVFVEKFEQEISHYKRRREVKPGITGLAQICLPYDANAKVKLEYDVFYIENQESLLFNFIISYYTALKMMTCFKN